MHIKPSRKKILILNFFLSIRDPDWKFYLNLAGSELPLVPMSEIEEILSKLSPYQVFASYRKKNM
jgi:hypothetical protein